MAGLPAYLYYRGTNNNLWQYHLQTGAVSNLGGYQCISRPTVPGDGNVYFQGTDNKLWQVNIAKPQPGINLGGYLCSSSPTVRDGYLYFEATDSSPHYFQITSPTPLMLPYSIGSQPSPGRSQ